MRIILAKPRGFCAGAIRAIKTVTRTLKRYGRPIYILHEIVHNRHVLEELRERGGIFVESLGEVPDGSILIFSAHGVATSVVKTAESKGLQIVDATCPLISEIHHRARQYSLKGYEIVIIGHPDHPEIAGTRGRIEGPVHVLSSLTEVESLQVANPEKIAYVTQTTLSYDDTIQIIRAIKKRFNLDGPDLSNVCYATQARQKSVRMLAGTIDLLLVVGSQNSSNSNRLKEIGEQCGVVSHLIEDEQAIDHSWFSEDLTVGVTAGASAPETMVQRVVERLRTEYSCTVGEMTGIEIERFIPRRRSYGDLAESSGYRK